LLLCFGFRLQSAGATGGLRAFSLGCAWRQAFCRMPDGRGFATHNRHAPSHFETRKNGRRVIAVALTDAETGAVGFALQGEKPTRNDQASPNT
jgi:hypothetical protein